MIRHLPKVILACATAFISACATQAPMPAPSAPARVVGYYFGPTATRGFPVSSIRGDQLTHIIYAFGRILPDGSVTLGSPAVDSANFAQILALKQRYPHLKVVISFGGWGGSVNFSDAALTPESRARFISTTLNTFFRPFPGVFDGVDLDWEYPVRGGPPGIVNRPEDRENLTALVSEFRAALDAEYPDRHNLVTIAAPAGAMHIVKYEMPKLAGLLDFINLMTYDFHTGGKIAHYNSPLGASKHDPTPDFNIEKSADAWIAAGVARENLLIGVPFYGYGYAGVNEVDHGRFQPITGYDTTQARPKWVGAVRYYQIKDVLNDRFTRYWDKGAKVPWLYNAGTHIWITYDDVRSIGEKAKFVRKHRLGGIMIWELSGDDGTLLPEINKQLGR